MYADIIVDISQDKLDKTFQYHIPSELEDKVSVGTRVLAPFGKGNRLISGYVIDIKEESSFDKDRIKDIQSVDSNSFPAIERMIKLAFWMKHEFGSTMNQALKTVLPVKDKVKAVSRKRIVLKADEDSLNQIIEKNVKSNAVARVRLLQALKDENTIDYEIVKTKLNISSQTVKSLENSGIIEVLEDNIYRNPVSSRHGEADYRFELNLSQKSAVDTFIRDYDEGKRKTYLLYGVTGSGKTLCYMDMIEHVISQGKQVIMLIPEIALTFQTVQRFYRRFGDSVSILNSRMSKGERYDQFCRAINGDISIIIGPRSALFTPFLNLGLIVIDEEHEGSYKSERSPRYHARETAVHIAETMNASVVLGSATPSVESFYRASKGEYTLLKLSERAAGASLPAVYTVDLREELKSGNRSIFSRKLRSLMEDRLSKRQQVMLFLNKRGYAGFISCRSCGHVFKCPHCDISLTYHRDGRLVCHYCGYEETAPKVCPKCGSKYVSGFRAGTQQIEEMINREFPSAEVLRMDMDTTSGKEGHEKILSRFANHEADILVGTQMIVKGHDFPDVTLVGVLAADMSLYGSDYRAAERTFQLLVQASGRAGRAEKSGEVVIQSYTPEHYSIVAAAANDYEGFYEEEISYRKLLGYPPVNNMLQVMFSSDDRQRLEETCNDIKIWCTGSWTGNSISVAGPVPAQVYKVKDVYSQILCVRSADYKSLTEFKDSVEMYIRSKDMYSNILVQYDFN